MMEQSSRPSMLDGMHPKVVLFGGFLVAFSGLSLIANIILGVSVVKLLKSGGRIGTVAVAQASGAQPADGPSPAEQGVPQSFTIDKDDHIRGGKNAKVTLVEFSDFQCPFCSQHAPTIDRLLADYGDKIRLVYKHFPLSNIHPNAQKAGEAAECANEQGKFWEMHDKLFENQQALTNEDLKRYATTIGLNAGKFNDCLDSGKMASKVSDDYQEGLKKGVQGTPATFVDGVLVSGAQPYENFKAAIDAALQK